MQKGGHPGALGPSAWTWHRWRGVLMQPCACGDQAAATALPTWAPHFTGTTVWDTLGRRF